MYLRPMRQPLANSAEPTNAKTPGTVSPMLMSTTPPTKLRTAPVMTTLERKTVDLGVALELTPGETVAATDHSACLRDQDRDAYGDANRGDDDPE